MSAATKQGRNRSAKAATKEPDATIQTQPEGTPATDERPLIFNQVWFRLQQNPNNFTGMQFRRALSSCGFPSWDQHNTALFRAIEKKARELLSSEAFVLNVIKYYRKAPGADALGLCRFASIHAGFMALHEVMRELDEQ